MASAIMQFVETFESIRVVNCDNSAINSSRIYNALLFDEGTRNLILSGSTPRQNVLRTRGLTPASRPLFKILLFWRIKSQHQLPVGNLKKVKTYKRKLGPE